MKTNQEQHSGESWPGRMARVLVGLTIAWQCQAVEYEITDLGPLDEACARMAGSANQGSTSVGVGALCDPNGGAESFNDWRVRNRASMPRPADGWPRLGHLGQGPTTPMDSNAAGTVVGASHSARGSIHAFRWTPEGGMEDLVANAVRSHAVRVNDAEAVIGRFLSAENTYHAFLWTPQSGLTDIGSLGGASSCPTALSQSGWVVGWANSADAASRAFRFKAGGPLLDLGDLGGVDSCAKAVSEDGTVVGWAETVDDHRHAFLWTESEGMIDLGTLGGATSCATDISELGVIIGISTTADGDTHACVWTARVGDAGETLAHRE
jgi:probable HAF family extracellular repeat protein